MQTQHPLLCSHQTPYRHIPTARNQLAAEAIVLRHPFKFLIHQPVASATGARSVTQIQSAAGYRRLESDDKSGNFELKLRATRGVVKARATLGATVSGETFSTASGMPVQPHKQVGQIWAEELVRTYWEPTQRLTGAIALSARKKRSTDST